MPGSVTSTDLRRDPRFALHSGSSGPDSFDGDAKLLSGRAPPVTDPAERGDHAARAGVAPQHMGFGLFRVELDQVVLVALSGGRTALVISSWRPSTGLTNTAPT